MTQNEYEALIKRCIKKRIVSEITLNTISDQIEKD